MTEVILSSSVTVSIHTPTAHQLAPEEEYFTMTGGYRKLVATDSEEGIALLGRIKTIYGDVISEYPSYYLGHYAEGNTTTVFTPSFDNAISVLEVKFYLDTAQASRKEICVVRDREPYSGLPSSAVVLAEGKYKPLDNFSFPDDLAATTDLYFKCDHDAMCEHFSYEFPVGEFRTYYGVSLNTVTGVLGKVKSYVYNSPSRQAMWDEWYAKQLSKS